MVDTIIKDINNIEIEKEGKTPQLILKFNSELKKLGFKEVFITRQNIYKNRICDDLTLYFNPTFPDMEYSERSYSRDSFLYLKDYLIGLGGSNSLRYHYCLKPTSLENKIELKIRHSGKLYTIGDYLPDRNIVIIYFPTFTENWVLGKDNQYIFKLLEYIKYLVEEYKIKKGNVEEMKQKILLANFSKSITSSISNFKNDIDNSKNRIKDYEKAFADCYSTISQGNLAVINLEKTLENLNDNLLERVKEIGDLKFVKEVNLTHEGIILKFEKIHIKVKEEMIEMGDYIITLTSNEIKIVNEHPVIYSHSTFHSPHIEGSSICFGSQKTMAYELLGKMELKKLAHFLFLYLKSYNPEDTYLSMNYWIKGKENGGIVPQDADEHEGESHCDECDSWVSDGNYNNDEDMCNSCYSELNN